MGWPWPWEDSRMTDYAYVWNVPENRVDIYFFGRVGADAPSDAEKVKFFPNMSSITNVTLGPRSGLIIMQGPKRA